MASTSVILGEQLESFVQEQIDGGRYGNASEVIRAAIRLLQEREIELAEKAAGLGLAELRAAIEMGDRSGPSVPGDEVFAHVMARLRAKQADKGITRTFRPSTGKAKAGRKP